MTSYALGGLAGSPRTLLYAKNPTPSIDVRLLEVSKNNPAKLHPDPIWNDGALAFLQSVKSVALTRTTRCTRRHGISSWSNKYEGAMDGDTENAGL